MGRIEGISEKGCPWGINENKRSKEGQATNKIS